MNGELKREFVSLQDYESGGAGLKSTVEDYAKFADVLACEGRLPNGEIVFDKTLLKEYTSLKMQEVGIQKTFGCIQGSDYGYGYGVRVRKVDTEWGLKQGEFGWDGAFGTYLLVDPNNYISIVIGMNIGSWPNIFVGNHLQIVKEIYKNL